MSIFDKDREREREREASQHQFIVDFHINTCSFITSNSSAVNVFVPV